MSRAFQNQLFIRLSRLGTVYLVGGAVRDSQLGLPANDLDAVIAFPQDQLVNRLKEWGYTPRQIGAEFQTVSLFNDGSRLDLVSYSGTLRDDALRRDFTINAIYQNLETGEILDPLDGLNDLEQRCLKACGSAAERFGEDPLRVLRLVRFACLFDFKVDPETWETAKRFVPELSRVAGERVTQELGKILVLADIDRALHMLDDLGYFRLQIPELARLKGLVQNRYHTKDAWEHTCHVVKNTPPQILLRLAALLHDIGKWETASRECYAWGTLRRVKGLYFVNDFQLIGKNLGRWVQAKVEVHGGRMDNSPSIIMVKHIRKIPLLPAKSFEWVPDGKRHFLQHEKESGRLIREIFPRFRWSVVLPGGSQGEHEVEYLVGHHMLGTLTFLNELRGEADAKTISSKSRRFAWEIGWNGRNYNPARLENLLVLWQADFQGGKQMSDEDYERLERIQAEIRNSSAWIQERESRLDWSLFGEFAREKGLAGENFGTFKEQVRRALMLDPEHNLEDARFLEREYRFFLSSMDEEV